MSMKKRLLIVGGVVVVLAAIVFFSLRARRQDQVEVQTGEVERLESLIAKVNASGEIKPKEFVELQAEITGVITELFVKEGDFVEKGQLLLKIDPTQTETETRAQQALLEAAKLDASNQKSQIAVQESNVGREEANVRVAEAEVQRSKQALELAKNNFKRQEDLFEQNLIPRETYEASKNELVSAESALSASNARLDQAKASLNVSRVVLDQSKNSYESSLTRIRQNEAVLDRARDSLSKTTIRSPLTGVITQLNVEQGERAVPGNLNNPSATIMTIADLSIIEAEIEVDETDIVNVHLGQQAEVNVDALPDLPLPGSVTEIGNSAIQKVGGSDTEAKDFKVAIRLEAPPKSLRPGLSCTADITTAVEHDILTIPIQALTVREFEVDPEGNLVKPSDDKKKAEGKNTEKEKSKTKRKDFQGVFKIKDGKAVFVPVTTGITGDTEIEVKSGLEEGEVIVIGSYKALRTLKDGDPVKVEKREKNS